MAQELPEQSRTLGLWGATAIGVGAIVGGGIFVLAGAAFSTTGPAAVVAFILNGILAFLTAMTFAEISSAFPESGGAYTFAKKVLSVRSAFVAGWVLWFAYIVAGVLYALGFAAFAIVALDKFIGYFGTAPDWLHGRRINLFFAVGATCVYAFNMARSNHNGKDWATIGKVAVFAILILAGAVALFRQPLSASTEHLEPFFADGFSGLLMAMGVTFIALQGFDLIAAVAGEVKNPGKVIPKAMFLSLGCALLIYVPLLLLVASVGVAPEDSVTGVAAAHPESIIAIAGENFFGGIGVVGYWLVIVAALLSTLSALQANLLAASRIALSMARDHTLPIALSAIHKERKTPVLAIATTTLTLAAILFMVPDLASAGAAASLIFLLSFTLAHITTYLARKRGGTTHAPYKTPWFPLIPVLGGVSCVLMAIFQALVVPDAAGIVLIWLGLGVVLYWSLFSGPAQISDAANSALDPLLVSLRGHSPLILVPIANPKHTPALVSVANLLAARNVGRVLLLSIVPLVEHSDEDDSSTLPDQLRDTQTIVYDALVESFQSGHKPEALITSAAKPMEEIQRIATEHQCASILLGMGGFDEATQTSLELLLNRVACDVALMRVPVTWHVSTVSNILVPVGGRGNEHEFRTRLLASLGRDKPRSVTFVTILPTSTKDSEVEEIRQQITKLSELNIPGERKVRIIVSDDAKSELVSQSKHFDLMILGLNAGTRGNKVFGDFNLYLAKHSMCATLLLSRRRATAFEMFDPLRDDVLQSLRGAVRQRS